MQWDLVGNDLDLGHLFAFRIDPNGAVIADNCPGTFRDTQPVAADHWRHFIGITGQAVTIELLPFSGHGSRAVREEQVVRMRGKGTRSDGASGGH